MGLADPLQSKLLDQLGNLVKASTHIGRQLFELRVHNVVQGFDGPGHCGVPSYYSCFAIDAIAAVFNDGGLMIGLVADLVKMKLKQLSDRERCGRSGVGHAHFKKTSPMLSAL